MRKPLLIFAALGAAAAAAAPAAAQPMRESQQRHEAFRAVREGDILPLNVIRDRVRFPAFSLIGVELSGDGRIYRLRFLGRSHALFVDADARSGRILRCMGDQQPAPCPR